MTKAVNIIDKIERVPIEAVKPYWRNPRKNEAAIPAVKESIQRFGVNQPLVVDAKGVIVVGHTRYRAMVELGLKEVPVVRPKLTAKQAKEYRIADNKTGEIASWDMTQLIPELRAFDNPDTMQIFFPDRDLSTLLQEASGSEFKPVDEDQMDRVLNRQQNSQANFKRTRQDDQVELECPHCGDRFFVERSTIDTHPGEKKA